MVSLLGCSARLPRHFQYEGFDIVIANQYQVNAFCIRPGHKWDDGEYAKPGENALGCWDATANEIWIRADGDGAKALTHELCHKDGHANCEDYDW